MQTYTVKTLGCKLNQYESNRIAAILRREGWKLLPFGDEADHVIINTCTVTDSSDHKCRQYIRAGARSSRSGQVIVTGCLANRARDDLLRMSEVAAVYSSDEMPLLIHTLTGHACREALGELPVNRSRAQIKIQDGCDGECAYCIIPAVRGVPQSRDPIEIVREAEYLIGSGFRELVLTGITIGKYHQGDDDLASLLRRLVSLPGDFRIRVTSIEPVHVTPSLLELYRNPMICPHIHLPLQGGDDSTLRLMNRPYTTALYRERVEALRAVNPDISIGTDVIVGFPGEGEEEFARSLSFVESIGYSYIHQFTFSPRTGTPAASMEPTASHEQVAARYKALKRVASVSRASYLSRFTGRILRCTIERRGDALFAVTPHYLRVRISNPLQQIRSGEFAFVKILDTHDNQIVGELTPGL